MAPAASDDVTLRDGLVTYLSENGLPEDGGYSDDWVRFKLGPIPVAFPNSDSRKAMVPFHDLHHVLTGYGTSLRGEAEIGAWEVASGCSGAALRLNLLVMGFVAWWSPRSVFRAFVRGRHSRNLYGGRYDEALLERGVGSVREELELTTSDPAPDTADRVAFIGWLGAALALNLAPAVLAGAAWLAFA